MTIDLTYYFVKLRLDFHYNISFLSFFLVSHAIYFQKIKKYLGNKKWINRDGNFTKSSCIFVSYGI